LLAAITWARTASTNGASSSLVAPTHPASVERSRSTPSRAEHLLALRAEEHPLQLLDQQRQAFDLARSRVQRCGVALMLRLILLVPGEDRRLQRGGIESVQIGQAEDWEHVRSMP
jgi:hypothetical protein